MKGLPFVLLFTTMTFVAWGAYGPTLHHGATALEHDSIRAFVGVGLAYFLIAVIFPLLILKRSGEVGRWTITGTIYSLVAGAVGAIGALGILLALQYGGQPVYVMPLVFGFAPVVNTLVTAFLSRTFNQISPIFIAGVVAAALGAVGVLMFKPSPAKTSPTAVSAQTTHSHTAVHVVRFTMTQAAEPTATDADEAEKVGGNDASEENVVEKPPTPEKSLASEKPPVAQEPPAAGEGVEEPGVEEPGVEEVGVEELGMEELGMEELGASVVEAASVGAPAKTGVNFWGVLGSIVVAAFCWGSYGPMLHIGQGKMSGSRLRPFACVGIAYFLIAVAAPLAMIYTGSEHGGGFNAIGMGWTWTGMGWSFIAGTAGAVGALGVILAFNAGGKPYYVMPLIFGFAPVINTFISVGEAGAWGLIPVKFWVSLAVVIAGAVTVLINAPRPKPHKAV